jgi:hypothetical protein
MMRKAFSIDIDIFLHTVPVDIKVSDKFGRGLVKKNKGSMKSKRKQKAKRMVSFLCFRFNPTV